MFISLYENSGFNHSKENPQVLYMYFATDGIIPVSNFMPQSVLHAYAVNLCRLYPVSNSKMSIPVTARSKVWVCGCLLAGTARSNPAGGIHVCLV
jgi:hypothetical protein